MNGAIRIETLQSGLVAEILVKEGQDVRAGDAIFNIASARSTVSFGDTDKIVSAKLKARLESLATDRDQQQEQAKLRIAAAQHRVDRLADDIDRLSAQIKLQEARVEIARASLERHSLLRAADFVSGASVQDKEGDVIDQQQKLADLHRSRSSFTRDVDAARAEMRDTRLQAERDWQVAARSAAALEQELAESEARRNFVVRAPKDGRITAIAVGVGASTGPGQAMATLLPSNSELEAELYAPSRAAGFFRTGQAVHLRYQSFPHQKFGQAQGEITEISGTAIQASELPMPGVAQVAGGAEPVYRVRVRLHSQIVKGSNEVHPLKSGMAVDASVLLESRRLYRWILDPFAEFAGQR